MAFRTSAAIALLTIVVAQAASAFIMPEVVLMRMKRNPEPMRSFSFSGFNPNGQMAAFTGAAEYPMFAGYGAPPSQQAAGPYYGGHPAAQDSYGPPVQDSYGPPPSGSAEQPQQQQASYDKKQEYAPVKPAAAPADSKEQNNSVEQVDGGKKQYRGRDGPSSNAEASFNAWFPIMFGVFPNGANGNGNGQPASRGNQGQAQDQGNQGYGGNGGNGGFERLGGGGTTVIANSVSNGKHGVATSHAIAYGNPRSSQK